ncbi:hypothetical protein [Corynebacterium senegalense]|uniref:hypothetical protein n=1 Tax=Corynebacterium senegalense TaxID=2080750 RepID=UPI000E20B0F4|nr:hypothetical protein [Corynebacterium senegalense]
MSTKTNKRQQARDLATQALAEKIAQQEKVKDATQRAFLAQAEFDGARRRFAAALQELSKLGESQAWMRASFDLSPTALRGLLALTTDGEDDTSDTDSGSMHDGATASENETGGDTTEEHQHDHS